MMKVKTVLIVVLFVIILVVGFLLGLFYYSFLNSPILTPTPPQTPTSTPTHTPIPTPTKEVILDEIVNMSEENTREEFYFDLNKGDRIYIKIKATYQPIEFRIYDPSLGFIRSEKWTDILSLDEHWDITINGRYIFILIFSGDRTEVSIKLTREPCVSPC